jgi:hypothetical protein
MFNKQQNVWVNRSWVELQFASQAVLSKTKQSFLMVNDYEDVLKLGNLLLILNSSS